MDIWEVRNQRHERLEDTELDVNPLRHCIIHSADYAWHSGLRNGFEGYESLERTQ